MPIRSARIPSNTRQLRLMKIDSEKGLYRARTQMIHGDFDRPFRGRRSQSKSTLSGVNECYRDFLPTSNEVSCGFSRTRPKKEEPRLLCSAACSSWKVQITLPTIWTG